MARIVFLDQENVDFPPTETALVSPNGLLAAGGNLKTESLVKAYRRGIFPWFSEGEPILWWTPSPRMALKPQDLHLGRTLKKLLKKNPFDITFNTAFDRVLSACANIPREHQEGTWITPDMQHAYIELHHQGWAHSVEAWQDHCLVGGLYGIAIGGVFFGESMFSKCSGASKVAFSHLCLYLAESDFGLVDCQTHSEYLASFGARLIPRHTFEQQLAIHTNRLQDFTWPHKYLPIGEKLGRFE